MNDPKDSQRSDGDGEQEPASGSPGEAGADRESGPPEPADQPEPESGGGGDAAGPEPALDSSGSSGSGADAAESEKPVTSAPGSSGSGGRRGYLGLTLLALLLALAALGGVAYLYLDRDEAADAGDIEALERAAADLEERLDSRLDALESDRASDAGEIENLASRLEELAGELDDLDLGPLESELSAISSDLEAIESRVADRLEAFEDRLEEIADEEIRDPRRDLERRVRLQEAMALLRMGQDRMELAGDASAARGAFARAGARLEDLDDPALGSVRRQIAREREALEGWQPVDWNEITARLQALESTVADWTLRESELTEVEPGDEEALGWLNRLRSTFSGLVEVRRREGDWLTPAEAEGLLAGIRARLAAAELAAARRDRQALESALDRIVGALEEWFDAEDSAVTGALESMESVRQMAREQDAPDIGEAASRLQSVIERDS